MNMIEKIEQKIQNNKSLNIAIAGSTCSGKTTLADRLKEILSTKYSVTIIHQDNYYKDLNKIPRSKMGYLTDSINAFETWEFRSDVEALLTNGSVIIPKYDILTGKRITKDISVVRSRINIFEGLHVIELLGDLDNIFTIFLNTSAETCLERRIKRDTAMHKVSEERIREYFNDCIMPLTRVYILPQKDKADIILEKGGDEKCLLKR